MTKPTLAIICGGKSTEHKISLISAKNIATLAKENYEVIMLGISQEGDWFLLDDNFPIMFSMDPNNVCINFTLAKPVNLICENGKGLILTKENKKIMADVYFPVLHGRNGEDGSIQGLLQLYNVPFVGCGIAACAMGMDKDLTKRIIEHAGLKVAPGICIEPEDKIDTEAIVAEFGLPLFVKPASLGSSIGISKVKTQEELLSKIQYAQLFDTKVLVEKGIVGREIECAVLGNREPISSLPGEIIPVDEFYSFDAKYINCEGAILKCPAENLSETEIKKLQETACYAYKKLCCSGLSRVDFFLTETGDIYVNEINNIPGFTNISMYPKLWEHTGISQENLIKKLVDFALDIYNEKQSKKDC